MSPCLKPRRHLRSLSLAIALAVLILGGCGSSSAVRIPAEQQYPDDRFLTALGTSTSSLADAEISARTGISAQIRSRIESHLTAVAQSSFRDGVITETQDLRQQVDLRTQFSHGELIRIDNRRSVIRDGHYQALAFLSRNELATVLTRDYETAATAFARQVGSLDAVGDDDVPGFAALYGTVRGSFGRLTQYDLECRAVTGQTQRGFGRDQALWQRVEDRRQNMLGHLRLALRVQPASATDDSLDLARLQHLFTQALTALGLSTRGAECPEADYMLDLQPVVKHDVIIGMICRISFSGALVECRSGQAWDVHLPSGVFRGDAAYNDEARREAEARITAEALVPLLEQALSRILPVERLGED